MNKFALSIDAGGTYTHSIILFDRSGTDSFRHSIQGLPNVILATSCKSRHSSFFGAKRKWKPFKRDKSTSSTLKFIRSTCGKSTPRAEISTLLTGLKFCCDYMTNFSTGWNISLGTKYEIASEESRENQAAILFPAFQSGLNSSPCNRQFDFKRISFRSRAGISARLAGLKFFM